MLSLGILFGVASMVLFGISKTCAKKPIEELGDFRALTYIFFFTNLFIIFCTLILTKVSMPSVATMGWIVMNSIIGFGAIYFLFKAIGIGKTGLVYAVSSSYILISVFLHMIFFNEILKWWK